MMGIEPITRKEMFMAAAAGESVVPPKPITREEYFLSKIGGSGIVTLALKRTNVGAGSYEYELIAGSYQEAASAFSSYMPVAAHLIDVINSGDVESLESKPINALYSGGVLRLQDEYNDIIINPDNTTVLD